MSDKQVILLLRFISIILIIFSFFKEIESVIIKGYNYEFFVNHILTFISGMFIGITLAIKKH